MPLDDFGIDHQPLGDVLQGAEDDVSSQEGLGQGDPPVRGVTRVSGQWPLCGCSGVLRKKKIHQKAVKYLKAMVRSGIRKEVRVTSAKLF